MSQKTVPTHKTKGQICILKCKEINFPWIAAEGEFISTLCYKMLWRSVSWTVL